VPKEPGVIRNLFDEFESERQLEQLLDSPLPSPAEINAHQNAEIEVAEYLEAKKLSIEVTFRKLICLNNN
jgi:hypothetical protein